MANREEIKLEKVIPQFHVLRLALALMIRQECFQSFIKRIVEILKPIIDIQNKSVLSVPFIHSRMRLEVTAIKLLQHPCQIISTDK